MRPRRLGVWMVNVHASGGFDMMQAAARAADEAAARAIATRAAGRRRHRADEPERCGAPEIGVNRSMERQVERLAALAQKRGLDGVVASPHEISEILRQRAVPAFAIVTPGIRGRAATADDQSRTLTAPEALARGRHLPRRGPADYRRCGPARGGRADRRRMPPAGVMIALTIYSQPGCHLCDEMKAIVMRVVQTAPA